VVGRKGWPEGERAAVGGAVGTFCLAETCIDRWGGWCWAWRDSAALLKGHWTHLAFFLRNDTTFDCGPSRGVQISRHQIGSVLTWSTQISPVIPVQHLQAQVRSKTILWPAIVQREITVLRRQVFHRQMT